MSISRMNRRRFLERASVGAVGVAAGTRRVSAGVGSASTRRSRKFVIGVMGAGGRGQWLLEEYLARRPDVEVAYVCDVDESRAGKAARIVEQHQGKGPKVVADFRRILDDRFVDAFFNVTPDHWHAVASILACQAGKDVYVEKPASHSIWASCSLARRVAARPISNVPSSISYPANWEMYTSFAY